MVLCFGFPMPAFGFRLRFVGGHAANKESRRVSDTGSIARSGSEDYWTRVSIPCRALRSAPDRSGDAGRLRCRHSSTAGPRGPRAQIAVLSRKVIPSNHAGSATPAGWRTRSRAASPTKRGRYCLDLNASFQMEYLETVQVSRTSLERPLEDYRTASLFDSPKKDQRDQGSPR
jgi:hypothetical protein